MRAISVVLACLAVLTLSTVVTPAAEAAPLTNVLVFSKTGGFRHSSIPAGIAAIQLHGTQRATQGGYSLWELAVFGGATPALEVPMLARLLTAVTVLCGLTVVLPPAAAAVPPPTSGFEKVKLEGGLQLGEPIELAVLPDQKVLYINRGTSNGGGQVRLYNPATRTTTVALTVALDARFEDGLVGITVHPRFATTGWVMLFYSPKVTPLVNRISRFTFDRNTNTLIPSSEDVIIEWPTERDLCCHTAGSMSWDSAGNLYFAVGDNTNSGGDSAGMAPIDERTSRNPQFDAQRTAGNTKRPARQDQPDSPGG